MENLSKNKTKKPLLRGADALSKNNAVCKSKSENHTIYALWLNRRLRKQFSAQLLFRPALVDFFSYPLFCAMACACLAEHAGRPETSEASFGG